MAHVQLLHNSFKWELADIGFDDNYSIRYTGYDFRNAPETYVGTPAGDFDDFYTPVFDLTGFTDSCYLNFMSTGATRTSRAVDINDSLEIYYSLGLSATWNKLACIKNSDLANYGVQFMPYMLNNMSNWVPRSYSLTQLGRNSHVAFRFRYHPGTDSNYISTGNYFYLGVVNK